MSINKRIRSEGRQIVYNVLKYCEEEKLSGHLKIPLQQAMDRSSAMTGINRKTLARIKKEGSLCEASGSKILTPGKNRRTRKDKFELDEFEMCTLRNLVLSFYSVKKEVPSIKKITVAFNAYRDKHVSREPIRRFLPSLGFEFTKCKNKRRLLIEKPEITAWRARYLRRMLQNEIAVVKKPVIYLDETFIDSTCTSDKYTQLDDNKKTSVTKNTPSGGQRFVIVHAGSEKGFIPGAFLMFKSQSKKGNHHDMNFASFSKWMIEMLIPNLPNNSIVVMDNAPYHSVVVNKSPTVMNRKAEIVSWLVTNGIIFDENMTKAELLELVKMNRKEKQYKIDEILQQAGHELCWLPPYHCDLNAIELIWDMVKRRVAEKNLTWDSTKLEELTKDAVNSITEENWRISCSHVSTIAARYRENDSIIDAGIEKIIDNLQDTSDDEDDSEDDDYDDDEDNESEEEN